MAPTYAGVLGPLAFATVLARGVVFGGGMVGTMKAACVCMFLFAAIGYLVRRLAESAVQQSCAWHFAQEQTDTTPPTNNSRAT